MSFSTGAWSARVSLTLAICAASVACAAAPLDDRPLRTADDPAATSASLPSPSASPGASPGASVSASAAASAPDGSALAEPPVPPVPQPDEVTGGFRTEPPGPRPPRAEMDAAAALVWEVSPAGDNPRGPTGRDTIVTHFVVAAGSSASVQATRREAVFAGSTSLWHLAAAKRSVKAMDCRLTPPRETLQPRHHIVFERLGKRPARIAPMETIVASATSARFDLVAATGPYVTYVIDAYTADCESGRPYGSPYREIIDLDTQKLAVLTEPPAARAGLLDTVNRAFAAGCADGENETRAGVAGLRYDRAGDLVAEYDFFRNAASACYHGTLHVFAGSFALPPQLSPHARAPAWLRAWLAEHPSSSLAVIPRGREAESLKEFQRLPEVAAPLPLFSSSD